MEKIEKMPYFNCRSLKACFEELCLSDLVHDFIFIWGSYLLSHYVITVYKISVTFNAHNRDTAE